MLFSLLSYIFTAIAIEQELGTVRTTYRFIALGLLTMVTFTIICALTGFNQISLGLWPLMFADMVYICMKNPT
jgi:hypothetical protein